MTKIKNVALIGLGAIGGFVAPRVQKTLGNEHFYLIANGERKQRLESQGMIVNGEQYYFQVKDSNNKEEADLIIFAVKFTALEQALEDVRSHVGKHTIFMALLNGVESEEVIQKAYPDQKVLYSVIRVPALHSGNQVTYPPDKGRISFGEAENDILSKDVQGVKDLFDVCKIPYEIPKDMIRNMWFKFMTNVSENQSSAILRAPYGIWKISKEANHLREEAAKEVIAIAQKKGINLTIEDLEDHKEYLLELPFEGKPSTCQDIEAGRKTEVDMFAGSVIKMGQELGVPTPYNQMFYDCIKSLESWNEVLREKQKLPLEL